MRIRVIDIVGMLAEGVPQEEILADFPYLEPEDIKRPSLMLLARPITRFCIQRELSCGCPEGTTDKEPVNRLAAPFRAPVQEGLSAVLTRPGSKAIDWITGC